MGTIKNSAFFSRLFKDKKGNIVIFQRPNIPIIVWGVTMGLLQFRSLSGNRALELIAFISIIVWSSLEIMYGNSLFRRILGIVVFAFSVISWVRL